MDTVSTGYYQTYDHNKGSVMTRSCHNDTRHVLITPRNRDVCVVMLCAGDGFDAVSDEVSGLE